MVLEDVEDPSCDGFMGLKKISTTSILETVKISPLTIPDGGVVLSRPRPTLGCSAHDDDDVSRRRFYKICFSVKSVNDFSEDELKINNVTGEINERCIT
jgi:hypothetical protein